MDDETRPAGITQAPQPLVIAGKQSESKKKLKYYDVVEG
jgi:hypothetical protein